MYNHILQYTTQKRESQHPYTTFTPSHCTPTEPSRNIPTPSQSKQSWPLPEYGAFHYHATPHFSSRLPFSGSAGSRRSRFIQQSAVRLGPAQHARPSHATGRLGAGFTQQSKRDRSATWWPGDIHNRPSVHSHVPVHPPVARLRNLPGGSCQVIVARRSPGSRAYSYHVIPTSDTKTSYLSRDGQPGVKMYENSSDDAICQVYVEMYLTGSN